MKTSITLNRSVPLQGWRVVGQIAFATEREWEPALLKLVVQRGSVTDAIVVSELLGGRMGVARRLLEICTRLKLLKHQGQEWVATSAGRVAAETGRVFIPEQGTWTVWGAEDELLTSSIVAVIPWWEGSAQQERPKDARRSIQNLPSWLSRAVGSSVEPLGGQHRSLCIDDLRSERGECSEEGASMGLTLEVTPDGARLRATGALDGEQLDAEAPAPNLVYASVWQALLQNAGWASQWDMQRRVLGVAFEGTSAAERSSMARCARFTRPRLPGLGQFDDTTVEPVPLRPATRSDAAAWAEWRLIEGVSTYLLDGQLEAAHRAAAAPFADLAPRCPALADLARRVRGSARPPPQFWRLQAGADWSIVGSSDR